MRKTTVICSLILVCSLLAFGQGQSQWVIAYSQVLTDQTTPIQETVIFTPTQSGVYRLGAYFSRSGPGTQDAFWRWIDITGHAQTLQFTVSSGSEENGAYLIFPKAGTPVTYGVGGTGTYNLAYIIEQLQTSN
jgi:hypothetical protein